MTELLWLFAGGACGAGVVFLWTKARMSSLQTLLQVREEEMEKRRIEMEESGERQSQDFKEREERMENHLAALQERCEALNRENKGLAADKQTLEKRIGVGARTDGARGRRAQPPFQGTTESHARAVAERYT